MYVDGFVMAVPKARVEEYVAQADAALAVWLEHGALTAVEAMADDVSEGEVTSFPRAVKLDANEVVFFSWITYRDRAHRDAVHALVMEDPRTQPPADPPFSTKRMIWGGFEARVMKGYP